MPLRPVHAQRWDLTPAQAREVQIGLAARAELVDRLGPITRVAGIDVGFEEQGRMTRAAVAVLRLADLEPLEEIVVRRATSFPYVPGLLSFREIPAVLDALGALACTPDLLICDGQGLAHPRRFGLACHLGWLLDTPCLGVAKSRLIGSYEEPGPKRGDWTPLLDRDQLIGAALRSRAGAKPVFVSPGHRVSCATAVRLALACTGPYRLPETTRRAHRLSSARPTQPAR